jgi:enoyl-CoA hydratase
MTVINEDSALVLIERPVAGCAVVTLNRPRAKNALSLQLRSELVSAFARFEAEAAVRVVILTGAGDAFCAGLDLKELGANPRAAIVPKSSEDPVRAISRFPWPVIAAVNGPAITGGFELALACDLLIASTRASFADTHARVGVLPGWGLSQRLARLIGLQRAKELAYTGNFLSAECADAWGLVNRVVHPEDLLPQALRLACDMLSAIPETLRAYKRLIDDGFGATFADGMQLEKERSAAWASTLRAADIEGRGQQVTIRGHAQKGARDA